MLGNQVARTAHRTSSSRVIPPAERNDRWLTPLPIVEALTSGVGVRGFDLDPCGAPGHVTAGRIILLEDGGDGLSDPWVLEGDSVPVRVWMNPPYGREKLLWIDRFLGFWRDGLIGGSMLIPADPGTIKVWQERIFPLADAILFWRHRIDFWSRDERVGSTVGGRRMVSVGESAIVTFGELDTDALWRAVSGGLLPGTVIRFV